MLRKWLYPKLESIFLKLAAYLNARGFTPNQLTLAGLAVTFVAGCLYAGGLFFIGTLVLLVAGLGDVLDGLLARTTQKTTAFGAFLDSTTDRYSDFFVFGGLAIHFVNTGHYGYFLISLGILLGSFVTSYAKARAENFIPSCSVGFLGRAERIVIICLGTLIAPLLPLALWILLLGTHVTAVYRILHTRKVLEAGCDDSPQPDA
ncbi:MAG: CDP-alcohol phosphatidyltransferase family protein [Candidatus Omnitrophica bacterium]|nr:CDP-alcohol phosphatidyltransferase family protein [Candidatus Omnitrophota bacterium]